MLKRFQTTHPSEGFDIVVDYDADTLKIDNIQDTRGEEVVLGASDKEAVLKEINTTQAD